MVGLDLDRDLFDWLHLDICLSCILPSDGHLRARTVAFPTLATLGNNRHTAWYAIDNGLKQMSMFWIIVIVVGGALLIGYFFNTRT